MFNWLKTRLAEYRNRHDIDTLFQIKQQANATAGVRIDEGTALNFVTVYACIKILSEDLGSLDMPVYQRLPNGGKLKATTHPVYSLLNWAPNDEQPPLIFYETLYSNLLRWGNAYAEIERTNGGRPLALHIIPPSEVEIKRDQNQKLYYRINKSSGGKKDIYPQNMIHLRCMGNGIQGLSPIRVAREAIALGKAAEQFNAAFFGNGARPGGVIIHPNKLNETAALKMKEMLQAQHGGPAGYGGWALFSEGVKVENFDLPGEDAMFLALRQFQREEICALFRVPPAKVQDLSKGTLSNVEQQSLAYLQTLRPMAVRIEQEFQRKLFSPAEANTFFCRLDLDCVLRADIEARTKAYSTQLQWGMLTHDEWREAEHRNPIEDPTQHFLPVNLQTLAQAMAGKPLALEDLPAPTKDVTPPPTPKDDVEDTENVLDADGPFESDGLRSLLRDTIARAVRREAKAVQKLAKKPKQFGDQLAEFYAEHRAYLTETLGAVPRAAEVAAQIAEQNQRTLSDLEANCLPEELDEAVFALTSTWDASEVLTKLDR